MASPEGLVTMTDEIPDTSMTDVAAGIAQEHVELKNDLRELVSKWQEGMAPDQAWPPTRRVPGNCRTSSRTTNEHLR